MINFDASLVLFIITVITVNLSPGVAMLFVFKQSKDLSIKNGVMAALGVEFGVFIYVIFASLGLGYLLLTNQLLFEILQVIGALYLIYLAYTSWPKKNNPISVKNNKTTNSIDHDSSISSFIKGMIINLTNPKILIFFVSLFPQFIDTDFNNGGLEILIYGIIFNIGGVIVNLMVAFFANKIGNRINKTSLLNYIIPIIFVLISLSVLSSILFNILI